MTLKRTLSLSLIVGFLCVGAVGCGDDSDDDGDSGAGGAGGQGGQSGQGSGGDGGGGAGGAGGMGGSGGGGMGGGGAGGMGGMPAPMPIDCAGTTCNPVPTATGMMIPPCCVPTSNACGAVLDETTMFCLEIGQEGEESEECGDEMNVLMQTTQGCCQPDGDCGLLSGTLMGCVKRTEYPAQFLLSMMPLTDDTTCTPGGDEDAGM